MSQEQVRIIFYGRVQGVGFRYTAQRVANDNDVSGWVKNNPDSSVEILALAEKENIEKFIDILKRYFSSNIEKYTLSKDYLSKVNSGFIIKY